MTDGARIAQHVLLVLPFEFGQEVVDHSAVEVLPAQMRVSGRRLHFEDAVLDRQNRRVEHSAAKVENEHVPFAVTQQMMPCRPSPIASEQPKEAHLWHLMEHLSETKPC